MNQPEKILTISTTKELFPKVEAIINSEYRLNELIGIQTTGATADIDVDTFITSNPPWNNQQPPILFPHLTFTGEHLLGIVFARLSNYEKAYYFLENEPDTLELVDLMNRLQHGIELSSLPESNAYLSLHNRVVAIHYSTQDADRNFSYLRLIYESAIAAAPDNELRAFTAKHYALLLSDNGFLKEAEDLLAGIGIASLHQPAAVAIKESLSGIWLRQLTVPYDQEKLALMKQYLWECLEYHEQHQHTVEAGMILADAAYIANLADSHSEALGYINRAIAIFEAEQLVELLGDALMKKGSILHRWAQRGNPQFFQQSAKLYQTALNIFTRENAPSLFADIHHQLGSIYSEIPDEVKKKSVWAGVSVASFNEALSFYNKVDYPYQFAVICNSQANAFTKYPDALHSDNFDKALGWYREALDVQTAEQYPVERSLTLLNYLQASWFAGNKEEFDEIRFNDMWDKSQEILLLNDDPAIGTMANEHLARLEELRDTMQQNVE